MLPLRRVDRDVDRVAAGGADEARERAADHEEERADVHRVAHPGGDEAVQGRRHASRRERDEPGDDDGEEREHAPQREPDQVRDREQEPEEDGQPRALDVVGELEPHGVRRQRGERQHAGRVARRVAVGDEQQVAERLRRVADAVGDQVAEAAGRRARARARRTTRGTPPSQRRPPTLQPADHPESELAEASHETSPNHDATAEDGREEERREREHEAGRDPAARLARRGIDLEVDGVPVAAAERRVRPGGQVDVRAHLDRVAQVRDDERLQRARRLALEEQREPEDDRDGGRRDAPERDDDEVRDREEEAEEDGDARPLEVVGDDDADGEAGAARRPRAHSRRFAGRGRSTIARCPTRRSPPTTSAAPPT